MQAYCKMAGPRSRGEELGFLYLQNWSILKQEDGCSHMASLVLLGHFLGVTDI